MLRQVAKQAQKLTNRVCPPLDFDGYDQEEKDLVVGYQNCFVMIWTAVQLMLFLFFLSFFLFSDANEFMKRKDCCEATEQRFDDNGLPSDQCALKTCKLYSFTWDGEWDFFDDRPRKPEDGKVSKLYTPDNEDAQYCCLLSSNADKVNCCNFLPWNNSCGLLVWGSSLAAMCGMLMTQVLLAAIYSIFARRNEYYAGLGVLAGVFLRVMIFFINFYLFYMFLFVFMFFWLSMWWCDNPYAYQWYLFGGQYFYYFFDNMIWVLTKGLTEFDEQWDMDTMVGTHTVFSFIVDLVFWIISVILTKMIKSSDNKNIFDFAYFEL